MAEGNVKTVAVVTDNTSDMCDQALYLDGVLQMADSTIYACDIAKHGGGDPICFRHFINGLNRLAKLCSLSRRLRTLASPVPAETSFGQFSEQPVKSFQPCSLQPQVALVDRLTQAR